MRVFQIAQSISVSGALSARVSTGPSKTGCGVPGCSLAYLATSGQSLSAPRVEVSRSKQSETRGAGAGGASLTSELAQKHRKVSRRVPGGHLEEHLGDPAAVVRGVVDYMHEDCATAHLAGITSHEAETHGLTKSRVGLGPDPVDPPLIHGLLRAAQRRQLPVQDQISCLEAVIATLDVSLPHAIDHVDVIQRADDALASNRRRELDGRSRSLNDCLYAVPWVRHSASLHEMLAFEQRHIPSHRRRIP